MSNDVDAIAPAPLLLAGDSGFDGVAPAPTLVATASWPGDGILVSVAGIAPLPELVAYATVGIVVSVNAVAPSPIIVISVTNPVHATFAGTAPPPLLVASGVTGVVASVDATAPSPLLLASGHPAISVSFIGTAPAPQLYAHLGAAVASAYRTFVLNTRKGALTEYNNFSFNSYAVFNGVALACGPSGIVTLGTQDADGSTAIDSTVKSGKDNFGGSHIKRVPRIYIDYKTGGDAQFKLITTEGGSRTYSLAWNSVTGSQTRRIGVGKGPKSSRWQWEYTNVGGADFDINAVLAFPTQLRRRVQ